MISTNQNQVYQSLTRLKLYNESVIMSFTYMDSSSDPRLRVGRGRRSGAAEGSSGFGRPEREGRGDLGLNLDQLTNYSITLRQISVIINNFECKRQKQIKDQAINKVLILTLVQQERQRIPHHCCRFRHSKTTKMSICPFQRRIIPFVLPWSRFQTLFSF